LAFAASSSSANLHQNSISNRSFPKNKRAHAACAVMVCPSPCMAVTVQMPLICSCSEDLDGNLRCIEDAVLGETDSANPQSLGRKRGLPSREVQNSRCTESAQQPLALHYHQIARRSVSSPDDSTSFLAGRAHVSGRKLTHTSFARPEDVGSDFQGVGLCRRRMMPMQGKGDVHLSSESSNAMVALLKISFPQRTCNTGGGGGGAPPRARQQTTPAQSLPARSHLLGGGRVGVLCTFSSLVGSGIDSEVR